MKIFIKSINSTQSESTLPYIECEAGSEGALPANNGKYYAPKEVVEESYPDGEYTLVYLHNSMFEPIQEPDPQPLDKRQWELNEVEPTVRSHIENTIRKLPLDYISINEPNTWVVDDEFGEEAQAVLAWIRSCWKYVRTTVDAADINDLPTVESIINGLPELNII